MTSASAYWVTWLTLQIRIILRLVEGVSEFAWTATRLDPFLAAMAATPLIYHFYFSVSIQTSSIYSNVHNNFLSRIVDDVELLDGC